MGYKIIYQFVCGISKYGMWEVITVGMCCLETGILLQPTKAFKKYYRCFSIGR